MQKARVSVSALLRIVGLRHWQSAMYWAMALPA